MIISLQDSKYTSKVPMHAGYLTRLLLRPIELRLQGGYARCSSKMEQVTRQISHLYYR